LIGRTSFVVALKVRIVFQLKIFYYEPRTLKVNKRSELKT